MKLNGLKVAFLVLKEKRDCCAHNYRLHTKIINDHKNSDNLDADSALENSLYAKEKIIFELNVEFHKLENTLSNEREEHINEIKKLNSLLNEKEVALEELKKELQTRPTTKLINDLRKKVKILLVQLSERTSFLESAEAKVVELTAKVNEQQRLIQKLEDDILKILKIEVMQVKMQV